MNMAQMNGLVRWYLKKAARQAVVLGASASGWPAMLAAVDPSPQVRVLTYHRFGTTGRDPYCVSRDVFERQMAWVAAQGCAVSLADVEAFIGGKKTPPRNAVLVTIDDGCVSVYRDALPVLRRHRIPAVVFVPAGEIGHDDGTPHDAGCPERRLTWSELVALSAGGLTIGSHAWTHRSLAHLSALEMREETECSRTVLERNTGQRVTAFAYPFGTRADFNGETTAAVRRSGYTCAFTSQHGALRRGADVWTLPRVKVEGGEAPWMFPLLCRGALDGWRWVDRTLWRLQERAG